MGAFGLGFGDKSPRPEPRNEDKRSRDEPVDARASLGLGGSRLHVDLASATSRTDVVSGGKEEA
jgi:hypothetical protein